MRPWLLACASLLLLTSAAGCFERSGTLAVRLTVADQGALGEFSQLPVTLKDVRIKAHTLNLETYPSAVPRLELRSASQGGQAFEVFKQTVRADTYERIEVTTQGSTFQGTRTDGSTVGVGVPGGVFVVTPSFDLPRGGSATYTLAIQVSKDCSGTGSCTYSVVPYPEGSHVG